MEQANHFQVERFSFKPLELDSSCSVDSMEEEAAAGDHAMSSYEIFRDLAYGDEDLNVTASGVEVAPAASSSSSSSASMLVRRANPVYEYVMEQRQEQEGQDPRGRLLLDEDPSTSHRVISPYPFSPPSQEEIEEREQLATTGGLEWSVDQERTHQLLLQGKETSGPAVNYSRFFEYDTVLSSTKNTSEQVFMECDDFSLSSHEANSLSDDLCLETISEDPASFWEEGIGASCSSSSSLSAGRSYSPTAVSLASTEPTTPASPDSIRASPESKA